VISKTFDASTKLSFGSQNGDCYVVVGSLRDNDASADIVRGKLRLSSTRMAEFFEPAVVATVNAINSYTKEITTPITSIYFVGGFSASPYMKAQITQRLPGMSINTPDGQTAKAAADGAIHYYIDHYVRARVAKVTYGVGLFDSYDENDPEHQRRKHLLTYAGGIAGIPYMFKKLIAKGTCVNEETEFREESTAIVNLKKGDTLRISDIVVYRGEGDPPRWMDETKNKDDFQTICTLQTDYRDIPLSASSIWTNKDGEELRRFKTATILYFGGPELKAQDCTLGTPQTGA